MRDFRILKLGLDLERKELYRRIEARVDRMFERGLVDEVKTLLAVRGRRNARRRSRRSDTNMSFDYLKGEIALEEAVALTKIDTRHYRQTPDDLVPENGRDPLVFAGRIDDRRILAEFREKGT